MKIKNRYFFLTLFLASALFSKADITKEYITAYSKIAVKEMKRTGIPASITLAQGILESGSGKSYLATKGKNHFGIKCTSDWKGGKIHEDDDKKDECFRKYHKVEDSYHDHSEFLTKRDRYKFLFDLDKKDYKGWASGLKQAGYATNPEYPQLLINLIEKYELNEYDKKSGKKKIKNAEKSNKNNTPKTDHIKFYTVKKGDTMYSISKKFKTTVEAIQILNNKTSFDLSLGEKIRVK